MSILLELLFVHPKVHTTQRTTEQMNCSIEMEWKQNGTLPVYCHICTTAGLDAGMYTPSNLLKTATLPLLSKINTFPFECLKGRYRTCIKRKEGTHQTYVSTTSQHRKESVCGACVRVHVCVCTYNASIPSRDGYDGCLQFVSMETLLPHGHSRVHIQATKGQHTT